MGEEAACGGGMWITLLAITAGRVELPLTRRLHAIAPGRNSGFDHRGLIDVKADGGIQYVCDMRFGTPPQTLSLIIDTGSSDVLVPGETYKCRATSESKNCGTHHLYQQSASSTYKADWTGAPITLHEKYQAGFVDGVAADDHVEWGGFSVSWVHFGVLKSEAKAVEFARADGIVGMAFDGLSKVTRPPLFAQMVQEWGDTLPNLFSLYIAPGLSPAGSKLILGGYDLGLAGRHAVWHYTPVIKLKGYSEYTYWAMALTSMSLKWGDGLSMNVCRQKSGCQAIIDSGMWGVGVPRRYFDRFVDMVTDNHDDCKFVAGGDQVYCGRCFIDKFPTLYFGTPPDNTFALRPGDYVMDAKGHNAQRGYTHVAGDECWLMFTQADKAGQQEVFVLGDTFLSTYYTLFDAGNMRIGLACDKDDTCLGGTHSDAVRGNVREGLAHSRVHQARSVGAMFAFSALCFYIFWVGEKQREGLIDFESESFGAGSRGGWGGDRGGGGYERVAESGISLSDLPSAGHSVIGGGSAEFTYQSTAGAHGAEFYDDEDEEPPGARANCLPANCAAYNCTHMSGISLTSSSNSVSVPNFVLRTAAITCTLNRLSFLSSLIATPNFLTLDKLTPQSCDKRKF